MTGNNPGIYGNSATCFIKVKVRRIWRVRSLPNDLQKLNATLVRLGKIEGDIKSPEKVKDSSKLLKNMGKSQKLKNIPKFQGKNKMKGQAVTLN